MGYLLSLVCNRETPFFPLVEENKRPAVVVYVILRQGNTRRRRGFKENFRQKSPEGMRENCNNLKGGYYMLGGVPL